MTVEHVAFMMHDVQVSAELTISFLTYPTR